MSDTPRTDEENMELYDGHSYLARTVEAVPVEFVRKLEREADQLAKQCVKNVEEIGQLRERVQYWKNACRKGEDREVNYLRDKDRLDWLDNHVGLYDVAEYFRHDLITHDQMQTLSLREGIDAAMKREA